MGQNGCLEQAKDLFNKLGYWMDESQRQFSDIYSHNTDIFAGIIDLVEQVERLQSQLSVCSSERNVLIKTVMDLNEEIRNLKSNFTPQNSLPKPDEDVDTDSADEKDEVSQKQDEDSVEMTNETQEEHHESNTKDFKMLGNDDFQTIREESNREDVLTNKCSDMGCIKISRGCMQKESAVGGGT